MLKDNVAVIGAGLAGQTLGYGLQQRNYYADLINGSTQDNQTLPDAKNVMVLEGYDGLAGDRSLAYDALKNNKNILKKIRNIEQKIVLCICSGGGTTGSGIVPHICNILTTNPDKIVCAVVLMPRTDEAIQKRLNAYSTVKELMEIEELGALILVNNEAYTDLRKINTTLIKMLDAFFSDCSSSAGANFDDSEKMKMLQEHGVFVIAMLHDNPDENKKISTQGMINALTAKNIFLPINNDGIVGHIGIINQRGNRLDEHEIERAIGKPENIFCGYNGTVNIVCASGLSLPVDYISSLGKKAMEEQQERMSKRKSLAILDDLVLDEPEPKPEIKKPGQKRRQISLDLLRDLD